MQVKSNQYGFPCKTYWYIENEKGETYHYSDGYFRKKTLIQMRTYSYYSEQEAINDLPKAEAAQFKAWFNSECKAALKEIPNGIRDMAVKSREMVLEIAESIARKKCFNKDAVLKYLDSLI